MTKFFEFVWKENNKYSTYTRHSDISVETNTDDIGINAHNATNIFVKTFGSLKKNEIIEIIERDKDGNAIGEPIRPYGEDIIMPVR